MNTRKPFLKKAYSWCKRLNFWSKVSILLIGTIIAQFFLARTTIFWYDEAYTVGMVQRNFKDIISITSRDVHTPFYYCVLKLFYMTAGGNSLISIKIFSLLFYIGYLVLGCRICQKKMSEKIAFYWLMLSVFSPAMLIQVTNARMYTFGLFWVTAAAYFAYETFYQGTKTQWILFTVFSVFAVYTHTFCMMEMVVVYVLFLVFFLFGKQYKKFLYGIISGGIVSLCYLPWLFVLWKQFRRWRGLESGWSNTIDPITINSFKKYLTEWFSSAERPQTAAVCFGVLFCLITGFFALRYVYKEKRYGIAFGVIIAAIILSVALLISIFIVPCFLGRYLFPLNGLIFIFLAVGFQEIPNKWLRALLLGLLVVFGILAYKQEWNLEDESGLEDYRACIETQWKEGDVIMADSYFELMMCIYYPEKEYMIYGSMPNCIPFGNVEVFTEWEQLENVDTVWYLYFEDFQCGNLDERYHYEEEWNIPFSYYDIVLRKYVQ